MLALAVSPDGRYLLSGAGDDTVRLWNFNTYELLITLFNNPAGEWIMWTPQGYYTGSSGGGRLIGWQVNIGSKHDIGFITANKLSKYLHRPDIICNTIALASANVAIAQAKNIGLSLKELLATVCDNASEN